MQKPIDLPPNEHQHNECRGEMDFLSNAQQQNGIHPDAVILYEYS